MILFAQTIFFIILLGIFCLSGYNAILTAVHFYELSSAKKLASQKIIFHQEGNKYFATMIIDKEYLLYYLNWFPEIYLSKNCTELLKNQRAICVFMDSDGNIKNSKLDSFKQFSIGPLKKGRNVIELYFESNLPDTSEILEGDLIFRETSNIAVPVVYLGKTAVCIVAFYTYFRRFPLEDVEN